MIIKTGIDIVEIESIKKSVSKSDGFIARYFGDSEVEMFSKKGNEKSKIQSIAANFAAKEAFSKSIGTGISGFCLRDVQVLRDSLGAPYLKLSDKLLEKHCDTNFSVSLSHTDSYAAAVVVAYAE